MNRIVILGANGQLGTALQIEMENLGRDFVALDMPDFNLREPDMLIDILRDGNFEAVVNCAAYTNVPQAEIDADAAVQINGVAMKRIAGICKERDIFLCHVSTDYVFDGLKGSPYYETDVPNPVNVYGMSKLLGEMLVRQYAGEYAIVRTAGLYGASKIGSDNIVDKLIRLGKSRDRLQLVSDEVASPTYAKDLAKQICVILDRRLAGIIHASSNGECSWLDFGKFLYHQLGISVKVDEISSAEFNQNLRKPLYSVLINSVLQQESCDIMPHWQESLLAYLLSNDLTGDWRFET